MERKRITLEMVKLYLQGMTPRQIGEIYNVSASSVGDRLKRMGYTRPYRRLRSITATVDKTRLETLYEKDRISYERIAAEFGVSVRVIRKALEFYQIPKRATPFWGGRYLGLLRRLRFGESAEILYRDQNQFDTLFQSAQSLGIYIKIEPVDNKLIKVLKISKNKLCGLSAINSINRERLAELYAGQKLPPAKIGQELGVGAELISQALDHYLIPRRKPGKCGGKYANVFRKLKIGETIEVECTAKNPYHNLHSIAVRIGIKISMHKIANTTYFIKRIR